ncbi:MAG TPA: thiamine phosphate synthase [Fibrobacteraceae bacterium]|nr:thiamine phosphate synthase [Fibrobacteraceae bacterium]
MIHRVRPAVLSIAGHDPSGGAGLSADLKVFEAWGVQGQSVCTALTAQNSSTFQEPGWVSWPHIQKQIDILFAERRIDFCKIGLVENADTLGRIVEHLRELNPAIFILWDPILQASAGFDFHSHEQKFSFQKICSQISLVTPNQPEAEWLGPDLPCSMLLKGGHQQGETCVDRLVWKGKTLAEFAQPRLDGLRKHGSGCVLSASITALLAKGLRLESAARLSRKMLQEYLQGTPGLLGSVRDAVASIREEELDGGDPRLYAITWDQAGRSHEEQAEQLCAAGIHILQWRSKTGTPVERQRSAQNVLRICRQWGCRLVVNDDVALAKAIGAPGVHLGLNDTPIPQAREILGPDVWIGGTANTPEQALQRIADGADYIGLGPWRHTETKEKLSPILGTQGVEMALDAIRKQHPHFPVYVIGGIEPLDCKEILELGATGVAVSSALVAAKDIPKSVQDFHQALAGIKNLVGDSL